MLSLIMLNVVTAAENALKLSFKVMSSIIIIDDFEDILKIKINN